MYAADYNAAAFTWDNRMTPGALKLRLSLVALLLCVYSTFDTIALH